MKPESEETAADEAAESPEQQAKEQAEGTEMHDVDGVELPEDYQKEAHSFLKKHGKHKPRLEHMRGKIDKAMQECDSCESEKNMGSSGTSSPSDKELTTEGMPDL